MNSPFYWNTDTALRVTSLTARLRDYAGIGAQTGEISVGDLWGKASSYVLDAHYRALAGESVSFEANICGTCLVFAIEPLYDPPGAIAGVSGRATIVESHDAPEARLAGQRTIVVVGVDHFSEIVETHGRAFGDAVLTAVSERLERQLRPRDALSRIGGDQFGLWIEDLPSERAAHDAASTLLRSFDDPLLVGTGAFGVSVSIGVAVSAKRDHTTEASLIAAAFHEMRAVKRNGGNGIKLATAWQAPSSPVPTPYATRESA
jgi:diguanylate cyclase (GGDEF)-like protein